MMKAMYPCRIPYSQILNCCITLSQTVSTEPKPYSMKGYMKETSHSTYHTTLFRSEVIPNDWAIFDNFRLLYYGDGETNKPEDFVSAIDETKATGQAKVVTSAWYTLNGLRVAEPKQRGIYIRQDLMDDGTRKSVKVMIK